MTTNDFLALLGFCIFAITISLVWKIVHAAKLAESQVVNNSMVTDMTGFLDALDASKSGPLVLGPEEHGERLGLLWRAFVEWVALPTFHADPLTSGEIQRIQEAYAFISNTLTVFEECDSANKRPIHVPQPIIKESQTTSEKE